MPSENMPESRILWEYAQELNIRDAGAYTVATIRKVEVLPMVVCKNCAEESPEGALYCMHCGSRIAPYSAAETQAYIENLTGAKPKTVTKMPKRDLGTFFSKLVGVTFDNEDGTNRLEVLSGCRAGEHLELRHTPVEQDKNAVAVHRLNGSQVGWLSREVAKTLADYLDAAARIDVTITEITGDEDEKERMGCNIAIAQIV